MTKLHSREPSQQLMVQGTSVAKTTLSVRGKLFIIVNVYIMCSLDVVTFDRGGDWASKAYQAPHTVHLESAKYDIPMNLSGIAFKPRPLKVNVLTQEAQKKKGIPASSKYADLTKWPSKDGTRF